MVVEGAEPKNYTWVSGYRVEFKRNEKGAYKNVRSYFKKQNCRGNPKTTQKPTEKESESRTPNPRSRSKPWPTNNEPPETASLATFSQTVGNSTERAQTQRSGASAEPSPRNHRQTPEQTKPDGASSFPVTDGRDSPEKKRFSGLEKSFPVSQMTKLPRGDQMFFYKIRGLLPPTSQLVRIFSRVDDFLLDWIHNHHISLRVIPSFRGVPICEALEKKSLPAMLAD
ncbi:hypothetical protein TIFTF001_002801 [Ficus carica]|uniref:Uncharacterized protein n=1 Tax=Ficus carica TaxID=3494 RepID=A0AA87ZEY6_FICCA|nr:hypothetical protein TIFTF001_002801 [Ficus carica]